MELNPLPHALTARAEAKQILSNRNVAFGLVATTACLATLALHAIPLFHPMIVYDDFAILAKSLTWSATWQNLWLTQNEHAMPLGRLTTWGLVQVAGRPSHFPFTVALQGPFAFLVSLGLLYRFVRRELGYPFYGLTAMIVFGVTSVYTQAVDWFAASFSILALDMLLLGLLAAQRWRQTGRHIHLVLCVFWTALAPAWFASGVLAGPLCCLYLLPQEGERLDSRGEGQPTLRWLLSSLARRLSPLLGTAVFLAISLPRTAERIMHTSHYEGRTALESFGPWTGLLYTDRSLVDNLALGVVGVGTVSCPLWLLPFALFALGSLLWWWWRPVPQRRLLVLGLGFILLSYFLTYGARAGWDYDRNLFTWPHWGRYHLQPQLGLALLVCGALPWRRGLTGAPDPAGGLSPWQTRGLLLLIGALLIVQFPRAFAVQRHFDPGQGEALQQVEVMDARCREYHIAADTARAALGKLGLPFCGEDDNGWELLRGSEQPRPMTVEEARHLLDVPAP
jgi:hypothetical protein